MSYIGRGIDQIDNISTLDNLSFSGSTATFNLTQNSVAFVPVSADALQIQIDGVIQSGNYTVSGSTVTFDFTPSGSSVCNGIKHFGVGVLTQPSDGSVNIAQLGASGTKDATTFLRGDNTFATVSGTTINNNADNRIITGSGTANTLEGESGLTYDGTTLLYSKNDASVLKALEFKNLQADAGTVCGISLDFELDNTNTNNSKAQIAVKEDAGDGYATIVFSTSPRSNSSTLEERMRIESDGTIAIPDSTDTGRILIEGGFNNPQIGIIGPTTSNTNKMYFSNGNGTVGTIATSGTSTSYNTSSDYRLKENEVALSNGIERLKQLKPYRFNFKADTDTTVDGFFAHEVSSVVPEAISGEKDATETYTDDNGDEQTRINPQGIDQSKLVPLLTSALQEAITKIETLEARVQTLENA